MKFIKNKIVQNCSSFGCCCNKDDNLPESKLRYVQNQIVYPFSFLKVEIKLTARTNVFET